MNFKYHFLILTVQLNIMRMLYVNTGFFRVSVHVSLLRFPWESEQMQLMEMIVKWVDQFEEVLYQIIKDILQGEKMPIRGKRP